MKIAIYDKWLNSLGGGEKVATVMAEVLSKKGHEVHLISNFDVDKKQLEEKMGVDLSKVQIKVWYERSYVELLPRTKKYDLLINVSFLDHMPSGAKKSIYYILFPTPIRTTVLGFIKYEKVLPFLRKFLIIPEIQSGIKPIDDIYTRGGRWLSEDNTIVFTNTPESFNLTLRIYAEQLSLQTLNEVSFGSPNARIKLLDKCVDHAFNVMVYKLKVKARNQNPAIKIIVAVDLKLNALGLVSMTIKNFRFLLWNFVKRYLPTYEMALYGSSSYKLAEGLCSYDVFLADSEFTRYWTRRYWGKESRVLYPPVDVDKFKPRKKKNIILNVGRFFVGGHTKRQDIMLSAFKKMVDEEKLDKSWELHFVGGVAGGKDHTDYLNKVREEAKGYPVYFHLFAGFNELKKLYSEAKIYWHATGYGVNENAEPIKFEHFGITVVEAMAAGCIPVVYNGGGLVETVGTDSGLTWWTDAELVKITSDIIKNSKKYAKLPSSLQEKAKKFSRQEFAKRLITIIES